jgi:hypothetical protein
MTRNWIRRVSVAGALVLSLVLAAPAQASGWTLHTSGPGVVQAAWEWFAELWATPWQKTGSGLDPLGTKSDQGSGLDPLGTKSDRGSGIDPDGAAATTLPCQPGC